MPHTSPYFNSVFPGQSSEQGLVDDLVREQIKIYGLDILYMPRRHLNLDLLLHESTKNAFEFAMPIPMYLKTVDGFDNGMEVLSKFGVRSSDEVTLVMSRSEFTTYYAPYIKSYYNQIKGKDVIDPLDELIGETDARPKEGDLIFFPFDNSIFEIKYVMFDSPFFQLGRGYVFEIQCEKFEYSGANFTTGYEEVDNAQTITDYYRMEFQVDPGGTKTFDKYERVDIYNLMEKEEVYDNTGHLVYSGERYGTETLLMSENFLDDIPERPMSSDVVIEKKSFEIFGSDSRGREGNFVTQPHGLDIQTDGLDYITQQGNEGLLETDGVANFVLYRDPGLLRKVPSVSATVMDWDITKGLLTVGDLSDLDPEQEDEDYDLTVNKFDTVIIIGRDSGAYHIAVKAGTKRKAFDDGDIIQEEFDEIKIVDPFDDNPFGFV